MAEFLRPDADVSIGGWTTQSGGTSNLFDALNESSPDDADYIISSADPVADIYRFRISDPSSIMDDGTVRYRYEKVGSGVGNLIARLIQGNSPTTWDPSYKLQITLSNGDLTGTATTGVAAGIRSIASESDGLKYAEITLTSASHTNLVVGIANGSWNPGINNLGDTLDGLSWFSNGNVRINNVSVGTVNGFADGNTLCIAADFDSEKIWFRVNNGNWNNDVIGNQNPATNTGGIDFSSLNAGPYFIAYNGTTTPGNVFTANFGATAYNQTPPSGATDFGAEAVIAEWEHTDIAASFVTAEQTLTTPQFDSITDFYDLFGELEASASGDSAAWTNYLARTTSLGAPYAEAIRELLNGLTTDGLFNADGTTDYFDYIKIYANQDATNALLNLVSSSFTCTAVGSPTFAAGLGYTGTDGGTTQYLNTGYNMLTQSGGSGKFQQNDAHASVWVTNDFTTVSGGFAMGIGNSGVTVSNILLAPRYTDGNAYTRINEAVSAGSTTATAAGHTMGVRTGVNTEIIYKNGSSIGTPNTTSVGTFVNAEVFVLVLSIEGGAPLGGFGGQVASASLGGGMTPTQAGNFYSRMRTCMAAIGVPVP